jgi:hypothetical protein
MKLCCPENFLLVQIERKFQDKDGNLHIDPTWQPEEYVTLHGVVHSIPNKIIEDPDRPVMGSVKEGDHVWFSYSPIYEYETQPDDETPIYKNLVMYNGEEYWKVHIGEVFCTVDKDGKIDMITDNALLTPVKRGMAEMQYGGLMLNLPATVENKGKVKAVPSKSDLGYLVGEVVCIEPKYIQKYSILGDWYYIVRTRRLLAKV